MPDGNAFLIRNLSARLTEEFGAGFDPSNLKRMQQFYILFPKGAALWCQPEDGGKGATPWHFLRWSHFKTEDGKSRLQVQFSGETAWLSLNQLADLFRRDKSVISKHIKNIFEEGELKSEATVAKFATVQAEGGRTVSREVEFYNLDVSNRIPSKFQGFREKFEPRSLHFLLTPCAIRLEIRHES
ncbi:MAG: DUF1016 family protein [Deltaproteobacteria bacterium]|nr:MAG: DUF1016 family protein [Deltaproteobacteria bacterium]